MRYVAISSQEQRRRETAARAGTTRRSSWKIAGGAASRHGGFHIVEGSAEVVGGTLAQVPLQDLLPRADASRIAELKFDQCRMNSRFQNMMQTP